MEHGPGIDRDKMTSHDTYRRPLRSLRISVTDRCSLRCRYCMPEEHYQWIPREQVLTFEEIDTLVDVFLRLGITKLRLTGGEPLLRRSLPTLIKMLAGKNIDLALTTNGLILADHVRALREAGLDRVTVSLDTLRPDRFRSLTGRDSLHSVLAGIDAARRVGFSRLKINTVVMRGFNEDEMVDMLEFGRRVGAEIRFIEYMDVGGATDWSTEQVVSRGQMLNLLQDSLGTIVPVAREGSAPSERFTLPDATPFGIISSTTAPFCSSCDRSRLTCDGMWFLCLYAKEGIDLKRALRSGDSPDAIASLIDSAWQRRADRGAEERFAMEQRGPLIPLDQLRQDYHLEMHTRGG